VGMCSIAVMMLLMTLSQSGAVGTDDSRIVKPAQATAVAHGVPMKQAYHTVPDFTVDQSDSLEKEVASQGSRKELQPEPENVEVQDESQRMFMQYVREAKLAELIGNKELSNDFVMKAQALLYGVDVE